MLPHADWLEQAKRLPVGMRIRVRHGRECRPNMTIANDREHWWAYCQRCKEGGKVEKEHVLLTAHYRAEQRTLEVPTDMVPVERSEYEQIVGRFLARKGMMFPYLPALYYSPSHGRIMLQDGTQWHGRDITDKSNQKWLHYGAPFAGTPACITILTEDLFSMFKVRYALQGVYQDVAVCSTLGSSCGPAAALALKNCTALVWFYDADDAGDSGFTQASRRMRPFVRRQQRLRPPDGLDPKDMHVEEIRAAVHLKIGDLFA